MIKIEKLSIQIGLFNSIIICIYLYVNGMLLSKSEFNFF